jgi:uncharacterized protein (DUF924 family)
MENNHPANDVLSLITPGVLQEVVALRIPWPRKDPFSFSVVADFYWRAMPNNSEELRRVCYPVLKGLTTVALSKIPNLMGLLPPPTSKDFPQQALGLILLLDQAPRRLLHGMDERWTAAFFDVLAFRLAGQFMNLPKDLQPHRKQRWTEESDYTFNHWAVIQFWFMAPLAHAEDLQYQAWMTEIAEELRAEVEKSTGIEDPYRVSRKEKSADPTAFSNQARAGPPYHANVSMDEFVFWFLMIYDYHPAIIQTFGRYPYRNLTLGRESTEAEQAYLNDTDHLFEVSADVAVKIREDILAGTWTPLGG